MRTYANCPLEIRRMPRKGYKDFDYTVYREWVEYQIRRGRRVLSRHETRAEAEAMLTSMLEITP